MLLERAIRAACRGRSDRFLGREALVLKESVHRPVNAEEGAVRPAVATEAQRKVSSDNLAKGIVGGASSASEACLVDVPGPAPLPDEVRLARSHDSRGLRPSQDIVVRKFVMFNPMARTFPGRRILNLFEALDDESDRRVPDRVGRGLEAGAMCRREDRTKLDWRVNEHPSGVRPSNVGGAEGRRVGAEGAVPVDLDRAEAEPPIAQPP